MKDIVSSLQKIEPVSLNSCGAVSCDCTLILHQIYATDKLTLTTSSKLPCFSKSASCKVNLPGRACRGSLLTAISGGSLHIRLVVQNQRV